MALQELLWIDDRTKDMEQIVLGSFPALWDRGIVSKTLLFGNAVRETDSGTFEEYQDSVYDCFFEHYDATCPPDVSEEQSEIQSNLSELHKEFFPDEDINHSLVHWISLQEPGIANLTQAWIDGMDRCCWREKDEKAGQPNKLPEAYRLDALIDRLTTVSCQAVALDVVLLENDISKLSCEKKDAVPVLSMELYHYITQVLKLPCALYSRYTFLNRLQNNWFEVYSERYDHLPGVPILPRADFSLGQNNFQTLKTLLNICKLGGGVQHVENACDSE